MSGGPRPERGETGEAVPTGTAERPIRGWGGNTRRRNAGGGSETASEASRQAGWGGGRRSYTSEARGRIGGFGGEPPKVAAYRLREANRLRGWRARLALGTDRKRVVKALFNPKTSSTERDVASSGAVGSFEAVGRFALRGWVVVVTVAGRGDVVRTWWASRCRDSRESWRGCEGHVCDTLVARVC